MWRLLIVNATSKVAKIQFPTVGAPQSFIEEDIGPQLQDITRGARHVQSTDH